MSEQKTLSAPVAIVGGGPVGLMLALFLDRYNVPSVVFNTETESRWHPKGSTHNSRTMEHYRSLGISRSIRSLGLPDSHPRDVAYFTRYNAWELARIPMPSEARSMQMIAQQPVSAQVPEPLIRANQMYVERFLLQHVAARPNIRLRFGWQATDLRQDAEGVSVTAERCDGKGVEHWRSEYLVGCDGAQSFTRKKMEVNYQGHSTLEQSFLGGRMISTYLRVPALHRDLLYDRKAWMYNVVAPDLRMLLISLNGDDEFLMMSKAQHPQAMPEPQQIVETIQRGCGESVDVEVLASKAWMGGAALVAEKFSQGRMFIAGDASHLFSPTGGFGMNTGIDGAANLAWKLAAAVQGWAGRQLLASYERERKPVAGRNTSAARELTRRVGEVRVPRELESSDVAGRDARTAFGSFLQQGFTPQFTSIGVELGARYDDSPLLWPDEQPPPDVFETYQPSAVPGGRLPHLWLEPPVDHDIKTADMMRQSLFDRLGSGFTLLRVGDDAPTGSDFESAAKARGVPFNMITLNKKPAWDVYQRRLVLVRPDQHVAWRSDQSPRDPGAVLDRCIGV